MTDEEWNRQDRATANAIEEHNDSSRRTRRQTVNTMGRAIGIIDEQEDVLNEYREEGMENMRVVEAYIEGNQREWEETENALRSIAEEVEESEVDEDRRKILAGVGAVGAAAFGGAAGVAAFGGGSNPKGGEAQFDDYGVFEDYVKMTPFDMGDYLPEETQEAYQDTSNGTEQRPDPNEPVKLSFIPGETDSTIELTEQYLTGDGNYDEQTLIIDDIGDDPAQTLYEKARARNDENVAIKK